MKWVGKILDTSTELVKANLNPQLTGLLHLFFRRYWRNIVFASAKDGKIKYASDAFVDELGMTIEDFRKTPFIEFVHPEDVEETLNEISLLDLGGKTANFVNRYRRSDGSYINVSWTAIHTYGWYICEAQFHE